MEFLLRFYVGFVAGISIIVPVAAWSAQSPVDLYTEWRGGNAYLGMHGLTEYGSFSDGGLSGPGMLVVDTAGDTRQDLRFGPLRTCLTQAGGKGFYTNLSGQLLPLSGAEAAYARADAQKAGRGNS